MNLPAILILGTQIFREHLRNRSFLVALLFSILMLYMSLLLGALAVEQEPRVLLDFGLSFIELMATGLAVYGAATLVLREMEMKTIYLILTRPISRIHYLLGRYLGMLLSSLAATALMVAVHLSILLFNGVPWQSGYLLALAGICLKITIASALALFLALATTSVLSGLTITGILWTLGHFIPEISFLARRAAETWRMIPAQALAYLLPNLQLLNFRDRLGVPEAAAWGRPLAAAAGYSAAYAAACLALAYAFFRRKEL